MYVSDYEARDLICEYGRRVYNRGLVAGNEGNLSCRVGENAVWVTPTLESKGYLTPDMLVKLDLDGNALIKTEYRPSSETKMHLGMYKESPDIKAVIHTHAPFATSFACSTNKLNTYMLPETLGLFGREVPVAKYGKPGTYELPESVRVYARNNQAAFLENHGVLTWGGTMKQAFFVMESLEGCCRMSVIVNSFVGGAKNIPDQDSIDILLGQFDKDMGR